MAGRVTRTHKNKKDPVIVDMVDYGCEDMSRTFFKRREYYAKKKWPVQYILYNNGKLAPIEEDVALSIIRGEQ